MMQKAKSVIPAKIDAGPNTDGFCDVCSMGFEILANHPLSAGQDLIGLEPKGEKWMPAINE